MAIRLPSIFRPDVRGATFELGSFDIQKIKKQMKIKKWNSLSRNPKEKNIIRKKTQPSAVPCCTMKTFVTLQYC
jgi:hypothetical protein